MGSQFFYPIFRKTSWPSLICRHVLNFLRVKSTFPKCKFRIRSSISSHQMLENWDFSRRSRKAVLDTFLSIFRILRTSKSSQRYENYNTFILMKSQTSFVRAPKYKYYLNLIVFIQKMVSSLKSWHFSHPFAPLYFLDMKSHYCFSMINYLE